MLYKISDIIDIPRLKIYQDTDIFKKYFNYTGLDFTYNHHSIRHKVKGYREK